jgi:PAS domain S-box-containing protein
MKYKLQDLIEMERFQTLQDRLNGIYSFPSAIIDNEGNILTATAWQDICTKFHRKNRDCEKECIKSDQYILNHLQQANPAVSYRCPFGLVDNALPIIIDGIHYGNFFTGQFFLKEPDLGVFKAQAREFGFEEEAYLEAVRKVPIWTEQQLNSYLLFIKELIAVISESGLKSLKEIESRKQLEESEDRANTILVQMLDGFWVTDTQGGKIIDANEAMCRMLGYTRDELLTLSVSDIDANDSPEVVAQRIQTILKNGSAYFESRFLRKDGTLLDVEISVVHLLNRNLLFGFHRNITERKHAQEALRKNEEKYRAILETAMDGFWMIDADTEKIIEVNQAYCEMCGYTREELLQMTVAQLEVIEDQGLVAAHIQQVISQGSDRFETCQRRKNGSLFWLEISLSYLPIENGRTIAFMRDITGRRHTEESMRIKDSAIDSSINAIAIADLKGNLTYVNPAFMNLWGYTNADLVLGRNAIDFWQLQSQATEVVTALQTQGGWIGEMTAQRQDSSKFIAQVSASMVVDHTGQPQAMLAAFVDITARKHAEEALRESEVRFRANFEASPVALWEEDFSAVKARLNELCNAGITDLRAYLDKNPSEVADLAARIDVLEINQASVRSLGAETKEQIRSEVSHYFTAASLDVFKNEIIALASGQIRFESEIELINARGEPGIYDLGLSVEHGKEDTLSRVLVSFVDITQRKRAEERLRESEERFREAIEFLPIPIGLADQEGKILHYNQKFTECYGYTRQDLPTINDWMESAYPDAEYRKFIQSLMVNEFTSPSSGNVEARPFNFNVACKDGSQRNVEIIARTIGDLSISSFNDVTERKHAEDLLRRSEEKYRRLIENSPDIVYVFSDKHGGAYYSPRVEQILGYSTDYLYTHPMLWNESIHPDDLKAISHAIRESTQGKPFDVDYRIRDSRGEWHWFHDRSIERHTQDGETRIEGIASDITDRKQRENEMEAVVTMNIALRQAHTRSEMLPIIADQVSRLVNAASVALIFTDKQTNDFIIEHVQGVWAGNVGKLLPRADGILSQILEQGELYLTNDMQNQPDFFACDAINDLHGFVEIPLVTDEVIIGFLEVASRNVFTKQDVRVLTTISDIAANAIHRASLHDQTEEYAANLTLAYDTTLEGWVHALELRDQETEGHTRRVVRMTVDLARTMGVAENEMENIRRGALLHDIGKMGIPDSVLLKPGTLNEREWEIMHRHPEYAKALLEPIEYLRHVLDIPYCHHEKWDGTGYPRRLKGEQIPLAARLFAIVDVWDALTSDRPYRPAWSKDKALAYITEQKGKHFDPQVVDLFLKMI